ncbi:MAG: hypothetical protein ACKVRO_08220 [Micropepsaceae bacterium]
MSEKQRLPQAAAPDWRRYLIWALIWVGFIAALGYSASQGGLGFLENAVVVSAEPNRDKVKLQGAEPAVIQVKVNLRNNTSKQATLTAPTACKIFRWQIFARTGDLVQTVVPKDTCPQSPVTAYLPAGENVEEFYAIALEAQRYEAGQDYLVSYQYWGYEGEFQFKAE